ncbi:MAG: hypothetical protein H6662_03045 [Ardenticatenaceae bacterium]|nr:hypothetical protein [Anaerolineales bacterium]MCB8920537.1 hypothetical protein [Ardenticatenaceae bacterium]MCB9004650.1 hypothetical protein [Ardenticatenaceae bacterium]
MSTLLAYIMSHAVIATVALALLDDLGAGALNGLAVGAVVGAVVWSVAQAPDTMGRVLLFGIISGLVMLFIQLVLTLNVIGNISLASLIDAFQSREAVMSARIIQAGQWIGLTALLGALLGVLFTVPGEAIKGAIIGLFLGALAGAILNVVLLEMGVRLNQFIFQLVVGLLTWGLLASLGGK